jgi:hypothetical protein
MRRLVHLGVDGMLTDYPDRLHSVLLQERFTAGGTDMPYPTFPNRPTSMAGPDRSRAVKDRLSVIIPLQFAFRPIGAGTLRGDPIPHWPM